MPSLTESIDALCTPYVREGGPGLALAVAQHGKVIYRGCFGLASLEHSVSITSETVFEAASVSKQVTAFAVHLLSEDGKLSLEDDVRLHVPELPDFGTPITIRHCLHHMCGLGEWFDSMHLAGRVREDVWEPEFVMRWLVRQRALNHKPGAEFLYTNTGYFVLASVVAAVSKVSFAEFCRMRIFEPLGMKNTLFRETMLAVIKNRADSYFVEEDGTFTPCLSNQALPGATSMQTTIDDLVLWLGNFDTGRVDSGRVGGTKLLEAMHQPGVLNNGQVTRYASGLELGTYRGEETVSHTGGWACYCSLALRIPSKGLAVAKLSNSCEMNSDEFWPPLVDLFFEQKTVVSGASLPETAPPQPLSAPLSEFVGLYVGPGGPVIEISKRGGTLRTGPLDRNSIELVPLDGLRLSPVGSMQVIVEFRRDDTGRISEYTVEEDGVAQPPRLRVEPAASPVNLIEFVGTFYSSELEATYRMLAKGDVLTMISVAFGEEPLRQVGRDLFIETGGGDVPDIYRFERDAEGLVDALLIGNNDARNHRFDLVNR